MDTSYYHRPAVQPFLDDTFGQLLDKAAVRWPDREAYVFRPGGTRVTFTELKVQVRQFRYGYRYGTLTVLPSYHKTTLLGVDELAAGLLALGTQRGDRIGWIVDNRLEWVLMYFAVAKVGAISVKVKTLVLQESDEDDAYSKNPLQSLTEIAPELETCQPGQLKT
ncbi:hypothetical protein Bbelb_386540 [Branchiostoma belcheri]|nr:hypothetical protein Bbelb_386540 [Branchiostoma belcheri]